MIEFYSVQMNYGKIIDAEKIGELTKYIIDKFSEEKLSYDEAKIILNKVEEAIGEYSQVQLMV